MVEFVGMILVSTKLEWEVSKAYEVDNALVTKVDMAALLKMARSSFWDRSYAPTRASYIAEVEYERGFGGRLS